MNAQTSSNDWNDAKGIPCARCGKELFKANWINGVPLCNKHFQAKEESWFEDVDCPKCGNKAIKLSHLCEGLLAIKVTCRDCGTFEPRLGKRRKGHGSAAQRQYGEAMREIERRIKG